jgi:cell division protein FtsZ
MRLALQGIEELKKEVDALITIPNDRLLAIVDRETTVKNAFEMCDDVLKQAVEGISDLITMPGIINVDFADIRTVMENAGSALMGIGISTGEKRAEEAARAAINSPLLEVSITGAKGVLFAVAGGDDLTLLEIQDAARVITESIDPHAKVIFGAIKDDKLKKNEVRVTVIATGFPEADSPHPGHSARFFDRQPERAPERPAPTPEPETTRGRIFNSVIPSRPTPVEASEEPVATEREEAKKPPVTIAKEPKPIDPVDEESDDDWGAVPQFLRKSRLK